MELGNSPETPSREGLTTVHCMDVDWHQVQCLAGQSGQLAISMAVGGFWRMNKYEVTIYQEIIQSNVFFL